MDFTLFLTLVFGSLLQCFYDIFITNRISEKEAAKCGYDCSKCGNFKCFVKYCSKKREELDIESGD